LQLFLAIGLLKGISLKIEGLLMSSDAGVSD